MRRSNVADASTMKGEKTSSGNHAGQAPAANPAQPSAPARNPSGIEPTSPRNTRAGGKLYARKPAAADAIARLAAATAGAPARPAATAYAENPIIAMPPASPSAPSMKLKRFVIQAMASATSTVIAAPP